MGGSYVGKPDPPRTANGNDIIAPTFEDTAGLHPQWKGARYTCTAGATNIFDRVVTIEKQLRGGWYELLDNGAVVGDYIEESVVDKTDVLGLFAGLGLEEGVDVLELKKYVETEYVNPLVAGQRQLFMAKSVFDLAPGLFLRTVYVSTGQATVALKVTTYAYN